MVMEKAESATHLREALRSSIELTHDILADEQQIKVARGIEKAGEFILYISISLYWWRLVQCGVVHQTALVFFCHIS